MLKKASCRLLKKIQGEAARKSTSERTYSTSQRGDRAATKHMVFFSSLLGHNFVGTLAILASFQLRAFGAEPFRWRIHSAADLVEILGRPVFTVHTEMPECAASFFAVSGLRRHTNILPPARKIVIYESSILVVNKLDRLQNRAYESAAETLVGGT